MKYYNITKEEESILRDYESGKLRRVEDSQQKMDEYQLAAKNTLKKTRNINIRLAEKDLQRIKKKAVESGIPYQTLVSTVLHQYASERVKIEL